MTSIHVIIIPQFSVNRACHITVCSTNSVTQQMVTVASCSKFTELLSGVLTVFIMGEDGGILWFLASAVQNLQII